MNPKRPQLAGQCRSDDARCESRRCLGGQDGGAAPPGSCHQGPRAPTSHLGGSGRSGTQSERLRPPWSAGRSPSGGTRGVSEQGKDPRSPCSRRSHSRSPPNRKNPIRISTSSSAAAPSARGRPRGSMAACGGAQGGARPQAAGSISGPTDPGGREEGQPWAAGLDGCPVPARAELPPHLLQRLGDPDLTLPEAGQGAGKGGGGAGLPGPSEQEPAPPPTWVQVSPPLG